MKFKRDKAMCCIQRRESICNWLSSSGAEKELRITFSHKFNISQQSYCHKESKYSFG